MTFTVFDHPFLSGLLSDADSLALFSAEADLSAMIRFEIALALAQADEGILTQEEAAAIDAALSRFQPDMVALNRATAEDGVVIPELVRQIRRAVGEPHAAKVHLGATSQDVIDTSLMLRLKAAGEGLANRLGALIARLHRLEAEQGGKPLMAYTRMQAAIPVTVADRMRSWREPLEQMANRLAHAREHAFALQFGGAAGTLEKFGTKGPALRAALARRLNLVDRPQWHSQRSTIVDFMTLLSLLTGSLGKFGQDLALMAELGGELKLSGGGGSSAMPHKQNPVGAEVLVALARFNAVQISGLHHAMVHEQERSGAAWMLEWMIVPQMVAATASSLNTALRLSDQIMSLGRS